MRSISGRLNRFALIATGLLALLAAAWLLTAAFHLAERIPAWAPLLGRSNTMISDLTTTHQAWLAPTALALAALALVAGIVLAIAQIPTRPTTSQFRIADTQGRDLAGIAPTVLARAVRERLDHITGVTDATVHVTGSARSPRAQAEVTIRDDADIPWVINTVRTQTTDDITHSLGNPPTSLDLRARLTTRSSTARTNHAEIT